MNCLQHSTASRFGLATFPGACPFATFETAVKSECSPSMTQPKNKEKEQQEQPVIDGLKTDVNVRTQFAGFGHLNCGIVVIDCRTTAMENNRKSRAKPYFVDRQALPRVGPLPGNLMKEERKNTVQQCAVCFCVEAF